MSVEQARMMKDACILASKFFEELATVFSGGQPDSLTKGAKHKIKEKEKSDKKQESLSQHADKDHGEAQVTSSGTQKTKGEKEKKKKKKSRDDKDKNGVDAIKRPLSAYMLFNNHRRPILKKEHAAMSLPEVSKMIGEEWSKLTADQKKIWNEKAKEQKLEYDLKTYNINSGKAKPESESVKVAPAESSSNPFSHIIMFRVYEKQSQFQFYILAEKKENHHVVQTAQPSNGTVAAQNDKTKKVQFKLFSLTKIEFPEKIQAASHLSLMTIPVENDSSSLDSD
ncbi:fact complex subunit ssrp1 [Stylonychia lemnae]|uniref:Fact complex subunit ssrp1 n=1 Tax=Stylonychia lemnae TaxID=5949 RepID=A0A077ZNJ1_STYLE|nr:fact complex subunit ssrp1 [Stylonychia lemnae]|eukprot:CDW71542.1 fact complex subunit ssrp1 [Stylonychia lemnae]